MGHEIEAGGKIGHDLATQPAEAGERSHRV